MTYSVTPEDYDHAKALAYDELRLIVKKWRNGPYRDAAEKVLSVSTELMNDAMLSIIEARRKEDAESLN